MWFAPNLGSPDLLDLFSRPNDWVKARGQIHVFKFDSQQLTAEAPGQCPVCSRNRLSNFTSVGAFAQLRDRGIAIAIDAGAIKEWGCTADVTGGVADRAVRNVEANGASVRYLAMDEPLLGGESCGYALAEAAAVTVDFAGRMRASHPTLAIGDIEPYPRYSASTLKLWLRTLGERGFKPAFFHLDVDRERAARLDADVEGDLRALRDYCRSADVPFGVIFWSPALDNRAYYEDTLGWLTRVGAAVGMPQHAIFQSWAEAPDGTKVVPGNLPEGDPKAYAHTRLVNDGLKLLRALTNATLPPGG